MLIRKLCTLSVTLGLAFVMSCGSDDAEKEPLGGSVGAACEADSQCTGYSRPACVTAIKPLEQLVSDPDPKNEPFRDLTLPFPGGYCSTTVQEPCTVDADCGSGQCFLAFEGVPQSVIDGLNKVGLPFDVNAFAKIGICLKPCSANAECRSKQKYDCIVPLEGFMTVINPTYSKKFCAQKVDVSHLLTTPGGT
jgi:hypothetical protein